MNHSKIANKLATHRIIGAGESTHGTHEFFDFKSELFKELVGKHSFNLFFLECPDKYCDAINEYIKSGTGDLNKLIGSLFYFYRTKELFNLFSWLRENNEKYPVAVIGLDELRHSKEYAKKYDLNMMNLRDKRMALIIKKHVDERPENKGLVWAHNSHIAADETEEQRFPMGVHLRKWYKDQYFPLALLFGVGQFSAARINEDGSAENSKLINNTIRSIPKDFLEYELKDSFKEPVLLEGADYNKYVKSGERYKIHNFGWGVMESMQYLGPSWNISTLFDGAVFFPEATSNLSYLIDKK